MVTRELLINNLEKWLEFQRLDSELSNNSLKAYRNSINNFLIFLNDNSIYEITKEDMLNYKKYMDKISNSVKAKNLWIISLNKYLKYLKLNELCLKQIKTQKNFVIKKKMSLIDFKRLLRIAKRENMMQDYWIMITLVKTGIRISELQYFTVENLKKDKHNIIHYKSKGKERDIIIPKDLAMNLRKYARENNIKSGYIFHQIKNIEKPANTATIWKHMQKIAGIARVNKKLIHAHSFRHLFATIFTMKYPKNNLLLADFLGHSSLDTTRIYTELSLNEKKEILEDMKIY